MDRIYIFGAGEKGGARGRVFAILPLRKTALGSFLWNINGLHECLKVCLALGKIKSSCVLDDRHIFSANLGDFSDRMTQKVTNASVSVSIGCNHRKAALWFANRGRQRPTGRRSNDKEATRCPDAHHETRKQQSGQQPK